MTNFSLELLYGSPSKSIWQITIHSTFIPMHTAHTVSTKHAKKTKTKICTTRFTLHISYRKQCVEMIALLQSTNCTDACVCVCVVHTLVFVFLFLFTRWKCDAYTPLSRQLLHTSVSQSHNRTKSARLHCKWMNPKWKSHQIDLCIYIFRKETQIIACVWFVFMFSRRMATNKYVVLLNFSLDLCSTSSLVTEKKQLIT